MMIDNTLQKHKILLVDDMGSNILMLNEVLSEEYQTYFSTNGNAALKMAAEKMPDLILLDIQMPEMDGMEVCRRLKNNPRTSRIPVIFITAVSASSTESEGLEVGAVDYITKPFNPTIVRLRVKNQIALKKYQDHLEELVLERTRALQQAKEIAEAHDRAKTKFFMIMSHELRSPLNIINGFSNLLVSFLKEEEQRKTAQLIHTAGNDLNRIIDTILDLTKLETGMVKIACHPFNLHELIRMTSQEVIVKYQEKGLAFSKEIAKDVPDLFQGDAKRIHQVLQQILDNAFKFTTKGAVRLGVSLGQAPDRLVFSIQDTGAGIPPDKQNLIFSAFTTGSEDVYTQHQGGVGIGLTMSQHILKLMHGSIQLIRSGPEGSEFEFTIACPDTTGH